MIVRLSGGLGNQMFQYAFGRATSIQKNEPLFIDDFSFQRDSLREYALGQYQIEARKISGVSKIYYNTLFYANRKLHFVPRGVVKCGMYYESAEFMQDDVLALNAKYYEGCWQNTAYFAKYEKELKKELTYQGIMSQELTELAQKLREGTTVAVHVRHGDYLNAFNQTIYEVPEATYYQHAMQYMKKLYPHCSFYFFSDDMDWCMEQFGKEESCVFPKVQTPHTAQEDIYLMQQCSHFIIANSSFSWWAAWLGADECSTCIAPKDWYKDTRMNDGVKKALLQNFILMENR